MRKEAVVEKTKMPLGEAPTVLVVGCSCLQTQHVEAVVVGLDVDWKRQKTSSLSGSLASLDWKGSPLLPTPAG